MKYLLPSILVLTSITVNAQNNSDSISAKPADQHVTVPGTHVSMIIPQGFKLAKDFVGLEKDDKTFIEVFDPYESDYTKSVTYFTRPIFEGKGMDVFTFKAAKVGTYPAKYAGMKNSAGYGKYELLFGDTTFSAMVLGHCSVNDVETSKALEGAIMSASYDKNKKIDPYIHTYFTVNDSTTMFKFSRRNDDAFRYTVNGNLKIAAEEASMTITPFTMENALSDKEIKKTMEGIYKKQGMSGIKVKNESDNKVNGYDAYESEVYGKINGKETLIYQLTVSKDGKALLITGISSADLDKNLAEFKKLAYTVNFKPADSK
jgi:hypothetical protein